jgi:hypothetical protein
MRRPLMSNGMIAERYKAGVTIGELAVRCRCPSVTIQRILEIQGVSRRSPAEMERLRREDRGWSDLRQQRRARIRAGLGLR